MDYHIILLTQSRYSNSRTYHDFTLEKEAVEHIVTTYERALQKEYPEQEKIQYSVEDLYNYVDSFTEFVGLVYKKDEGSYRPMDTNTIKDMILEHFAALQ